MTSYPPTTHRPRASETSSGAFWMVATMLLGLAVGAVSLFALLTWADARESRDAAAQPAAASSEAPPRRKARPAKTKRPTTTPLSR